MRTRERALWALLIVACIIGALVSVVALPRPAAADGVPRNPEVRAIPLAAIVSDRTGSGRPRIQLDPRHASVNARRAGCEGANLVVVPAIRSRYAVVVVVGLDGWLLRHGYAAGVPSSQGRRVLVGFTREGEPVPCSEVFSHPQANVHVVGSIIR